MDGRSGLKPGKLIGFLLVFSACLLVVLAMGGKAEADDSGGVGGQGQGPAVSSLEGDGGALEPAPEDNAVPPAVQEKGMLEGGLAGDGVEAADKDDDAAVLGDGKAGGGGGPDTTAAGGAVDPRIGVKVGFEYEDDASNVNPVVTVYDKAGDPIPVPKVYNPLYSTYELSFDYAVDPQNPVFVVKVTAPGYLPVERDVTLYRNDSDPDDPNWYGFLQVTLEATPAYRLGREMARKADEKLDFGASQGVLCITTAGGVYFLGTSSEDALEGVLNHARGLIAFGEGSLLALRRTRYEPLDFAFVAKKGGDLVMAFFREGNAGPLYVGSVSRHLMGEARWEQLVAALGRADAFAFASLANAWAEGLSTDVLNSAAFHGHLCLGTISGFAMVEVLLKYFPPGTVGEGIESTSYKVLGVPGGSDDDVFQWVMDATPGKRAYVGRDSEEDSNMVGFLRWNSSTNTGTLAIMRYDLVALASAFQAETDIRVREDCLSELHFNAWLVNRLMVLPESLVELVLALDGLTRDECDHLTGGVSSSTVETAWGLDMEYISILRGSGHITDITDSVKMAMGSAAPASQSPALTPEQIKGIGRDAALLAEQLFLRELGIRLEKDDPRLYALTSSGFARIHGLSTTMAWDGVFDVLGSRLSRKTLLPVHSSLLGTLWFSFALARDGKLYAVYIRYDSATGQLVVGRASDGKAVQDIGPETLNDNNKLRVARPVFGSSFNGIQSIANAMRYDPPYEMVLAYLFHNHVCPGVSPSYLIADMVYREFPLGEDERYIYITTVNYCKEDGLIFLLGLSAGSGSYYNFRLKEGDDTRSQVIPGGNLEGILIRWDDALGVGEAVVISFAWPQWNTQGLTTNEARREAQIGGFIQYYKGIVSPLMTAAPQVAKEAVKWITREELDSILSWSPDDPRGNVLQFVMGLPDRSRSDLIPDEAGQGDGEAEGGPQPAEMVAGEEGIPSSEPSSGAARVRRAVYRVPGTTPRTVEEANPEVSGNPALEPETETPSASEGDVEEKIEGRAYEVEEVGSEERAGNYLALALGGLAAMLIMGVAGFYLAKKRAL